MERFPRSFFLSFFHSFSLSLSLCFATDDDGTGGGGHATGDRRSNAFCSTEKEPLFFLSLSLFLSLCLYISILHANEFCLGCFQRDYWQIHTWRNLPQNSEKKKKIIRDKHTLAVLISSHPRQLLRFSRSSEFNYKHRYHLSGNEDLLAVFRASQVKSKWFGD